MIDTIVFDMDGTVLNTLDDLTVSMNYVYEKFSLPAHTLEEYRDAFGSGVRAAFERTLPSTVGPTIIDEMLPVFASHYDKHCLDKTRPYDGVVDVMRDLRHAGYKIAIVSNKIDSAVQELRERFFVDVCDVAIGEKPGVRRKPAPDMVEEALSELGSSREEAIYVGDSEVDVETASNCELPCLCVLWGFRSEEFLRSHGAKHFVSEPGEIVPEKIQSLQNNPCKSV